VRHPGGRSPQARAARDVDGLIIPGGESTTLLKLVHEWGSCRRSRSSTPRGGRSSAPAPADSPGAGGGEPAQFSLGLIDVGVERNAYGRQRESFEARGSATLEGLATPIEMVFIRAPRIRRVGAGVETLAAYRDEPVMARQGSVLVATFHPELTDDPAVHEYFCAMVRKARVACEPQPKARRACEKGVRAAADGERAAKRAARVIFHDVYTNVPPEEIERFVRSQELGRLVTVAADGTPHLGLYPFTYDGAAFEIHSCAATSRSPTSASGRAACSRSTRCWRRSRPIGWTRRTRSWRRRTIAR